MREDTLQIGQVTLRATTLASNWDPFTFGFFSTFHFYASIFCFPRVILLSLSSSLSFLSLYVFFPFLNASELLRYMTIRLWLCDREWLVLLLILKWITKRALKRSSWWKGLCVFYLNEFWKRTIHGNKEKQNIFYENPRGVSTRDGNFASPHFDPPRKGGGAGMG